MAASELLHLAEVGIGAAWVGIPAASVLQAIALPAMPALLPRRHGALAGVVDYEGRLVPVVDLARWVDVGVAPQDDGRGTAARVLILHAGGRTIGLKADTVGGLVEVAAQDVARLHHDAREDEVFERAVRAPASGRILSLLDAERLARLAAAWHQDGDGAAPEPDAPGGKAAPSAATRSYAVLQAGAVRLAVASDALTEVLAMPALETLGAGHGMFYCAWRGRHLPLLAPSALGLDAAQDGAAAPLLAVIEHAGLALGLPVQAALSLQELDAGGLAAPDAVLSASFEADGTPLRVLDETRLFARFPEAEISREEGAKTRRAHADPAANARAYIVFEGDGMAAAAIDSIERIVSLREAATDGKGAMAWEGRAIPLRDLRAAAGDGADAGRGDVMVVRGADTCVGYVVARVHLLVPPGAGRVYRMGGAGREFITTGDDAARASYRIVDLGAQAA